LDSLICRLLAWAETHEFLGDAIPFYWVEFGPDHFSALLGAELKFDTVLGNTSWCVPFAENWDEINIKFQKDNFWYKRIPEKVKKALKDVISAYRAITEALSVEFGVEEYGSMSRHGMYSPGKINVQQCDFSCMISSEMFMEFEIPHLIQEAKVLDNSEYHLDGPGAIKHLPAICQVEDIDVIQWVPGAGEPSGKNWLPLYKEIDALGKGQILFANQEEIKRLLTELKSHKLFFVTEAKTKKEAEVFLHELKLYWK